MLDRFSNKIIPIFAKMIIRSIMRSLAANKGAESMDLPPLTKAQSHYAEYLALEDGERWEMISGVPYNITPAPCK